MLNRCHVCKKEKHGVKHRSFYEKHINDYLTTKDKWCDKCFSAVVTELKKNEELEKTLQDKK